MHEFLIRIYPLTYFNLNIINNNNLSLFEEGQALIDSNMLMTVHSELRSNEIIYTIIDWPKFGIIKYLKTLDQSEERDRFSQQDINNGQILYENLKIISDSNEYDDNCFDSVTFNIGNDLFNLTKLTFYIELIPKFITLATTNITVNEGNMTILTRKHIHLTHSYYNKYVDEFIVVEESKYGTISMIGPDNIKLSTKTFTSKQLDDGKIFYQHDSSEYEKDWFTLVARANSIEKESLPATIHITIASINDEPPILVNYSEIDVWKNAMIRISNNSLAATDEDTKPNEIFYLISMPMNGYLINIDTNITIDKFSQSDINNDKIYFVHVGSGNGSFRFQLTDGKNYGMSNIMKIKVRMKKINVDINEKLLVSSGSQQSITNRHLQVSTDEQDVKQDYRYRIVKPPNYGRVILDGFKKAKEIDVFTQQQLNENLVLYDQNMRINKPLILDSIIFNIESADMPTLENIRFIIEITVDEINSNNDLLVNNINSLIKVKYLTVNEGKSTPINSQIIDLTNIQSSKQYFHQMDQINLKIIHQPNHGYILREGLILDKKALLSIGSFQNNSIVYIHDDSNTFTDEIVFAVFINDHTPSIANFTLPIKINPGINIRILIHFN